MLLKMIVVPVIQILDIGDLVESATFLQDVSIVCQQLLVDNPPPVVHLLEVGISEANEDLGDLEERMDCEFDSTLLTLSFSK